MSRLSLRPARPDELAWANARYAEIDFRLSTLDDQIIIAEVDGTAAGLGRIVHVGPGEGELGGMVVFDLYQGQGIAKRIIAALKDATDCATLYCLPFTELEALYRGLGFALLANTAGVPADILDKHRWCNGHYDKPVSLLRWQRA